jgi:hypothetical protein
MKKTIFFLAIVLAVWGHAAERPYFAYGNVHAMGGYPMVGLGVRAQTGIHAFDVSGNFCPLNLPDTLQIFHLKSLYLFYPARANFYVGGGLGLLNEPETTGFTGSFESAIGYQWANRFFIEGNAIAPFAQSRALLPVWPGLTLGFGF